MSTFSIPLSYWWSTISTSSPYRMSINFISFSSHFKILLLNIQLYNMPAFGLAVKLFQAHLIYRFFFTNVQILQKKIRQERSETKRSALVQLSKSQTDSTTPDSVQIGLNIKMTKNFRAKFVEILDCSNFVRSSPGFILTRLKYLRYDECMLFI